MDFKMNVNLFARITSCMQIKLVALTSYTANYMAKKLMDGVTKMLARFLSAVRHLEKNGCKKFNSSLPEPWQF